MPNFRVPEIRTTYVAECIYVGRDGLIRADTELAAASNPDQIRLGDYLDEVEELLRPHYEHLAGPMALRLDVGLPRRG